MFESTPIAVVLGSGPITYLLLAVLLAEAVPLAEATGRLPTGALALKAPVVLD